MLHQIHREYNLSYPKLTATITDNASNFAKAFKVFGIAKNGDDDENSGSSNDEESDEEITNINLDDTLTRILPRHIRCFAHTLSLCITTDVMRTIKEIEELNSVHTQTIRKCSVLWNAVSRPKSSEIVHNILGHTLSRPGDTRWNSLHDSLVQILNTKDKNYILHKSLGIKHILTEQDYQYIEEYITITKPLTQALDILQGENNIWYGYPVLIVYRKKIRNLKRKGMDTLQANNSILKTQHKNQI